MNLKPGLAALFLYCLCQCLPLPWTAAANLVLALGLPALAKRDRLLSPPAHVGVCLPLAVLSLVNFLGGWPEFPGLSLFLTVVLAAICEELIFRGLLLRELPHPLAASSLLFGLLHLLAWNAPLPLLLSQAACAGCLGYLYGRLVQITGSLLPGILSHCLLNATSFGTGDSVAGYLVLLLLTLLYILSLRSVRPEDRQ